MPLPGVCAAPGFLGDFGSSGGCNLDALPKIRQRQKGGSLVSLLGVCEGPLCFVCGLGRMVDSERHRGMFVSGGKIWS